MGRALRAMTLCIVATLIVSGCAVKDHSYFLGPFGEDPGGGTAVSGAELASTDRLILIWTDGSPAQDRPQYCPKTPDLLPPVIGALKDQVVNARGVSIFVHCPTVLGTFDWQTGTGKGKAQHVAIALKTLVKSFEARGVLRQRIFLAGQSSGGWASLIAARDLGRNIGGAIAFAPADHGQWKPLELNPEGQTGWSLLKTLNFTDLLASSHIPALVFAFDDDPFSTPRELALLSRVRGVRVDTVALADFEAVGCHNFTLVPHEQVRSPCFAEIYGPQVVAFMEARLANGN